MIARVREAIGIALTADPSKTAADIRVAFYGLAFKPDIDDLRESPAVHIVQKMIETLPGPVSVVEPNIKALPDRMGNATLTLLADVIADVHVLLVDHTQFKQAVKPDGLIVDTRGVWI